MCKWRTLSILTAVTALVLGSLLLFGRHFTPASANPIGGLVSISAGEFQTCAVTSDDGVKCWGALIPDGNATSMPADLTGLSNAVHAGEGYFHGCALTSPGGVLCWGGNYYGQLGDGSTTPTSSPVPVARLADGVAQIGVGYEHNCALLNDGMVRCWGKNNDGELGDGTTMVGSTPVAVENLAGVTQIGAGADHTCAVTADGRVWCWGRNALGQLGDGTSQSRLTPVVVTGLNGSAVEVTAAAYHTCARLSDGAVQCWGANYGPSAVTVSGLNDVVAIDAGFTHTCAVTAAGAAECWGTNGFGELGDGQVCGSSRCTDPADVAGLDAGVAAVSAGSLYSCAVLTNGSARCWGDNSHQQLGSGVIGLTKSSVPIAVGETATKVAPTSTPCPETGCPTPTPRPVPPLTGVDFSLAADIDHDGTPDCGTVMDLPHGCVIQPGSTFNVLVDLNALDPAVTSYGGFDVHLLTDGVQADSSWRFLWPDCGFPAQDFEPGDIHFACAVGIKAKPSSYVGSLASTTFTCDQTGSITLVHGPLNTDVVSSDLYPHSETAADEVLRVVCGPLERGDDNCDSEVNSIDAVLTLQYEAEIVPSVDCQQQSDVNLDSLTNAVDAGLTLQYDAKLIDTLPPNQRSR